MFTIGRFLEVTLYGRFWVSPEVQRGLGDRRGSRRAPSLLRKSPARPLWRAYAPTVPGNLAEISSAPVPLRIPYLPGGPLINVGPVLIWFWLVKLD